MFRIVELSSPETRETALLELSKKREVVPDLAPMIWHSFGMTSANRTLKQKYENYQTVRSWVRILQKHTNLRKHSKHTYNNIQKHTKHTKTFSYTQSHTRVDCCTQCWFVLKKNIGIQMEYKYTKIGLDKKMTKQEKKEFRTKRID